MPMCVLKRGDLCDRMSSHENEARFLLQNEVKFAQQRNKMAANLDLFHMHLHRHPNANKIRLASSIGDGGYHTFLRNCAVTKAIPVLLFHLMEN